MRSGLQGRSRNSASQFVSEELDDGAAFSKLVEGEVAAIIQQVELCQERLLRAARHVCSSPSPSRFRTESWSNGASTSIRSQTGSHSREKTSLNLQDPAQLPQQPDQIIHVPVAHATQDSLVKSTPGEVGMTETCITDSESAIVVHSSEGTVASAEHVAFTSVCSDGRGGSLTYKLLHSEGPDSYVTALPHSLPSGLGRLQPPGPAGRSLSMASDCEASVILDQAEAFGRLVQRCHSNNEANEEDSEEEEDVLNYKNRASKTLKELLQDENDHWQTFHALHLIIGKFGVHERTIFFAWNSFTKQMNKLSRFRVARVWTGDAPDKVSSVGSIARDCPREVQFHRSASGGRGASRFFQNSWNVQDIHQSHVKIGRRTWRVFVMSPDSPFRILWDTMGAVFLLYDIIFVPLELFAIDFEFHSTIMSWTTLIFWTLDIPFSCFTGFVRKGNTILAIGSVLKKYIQGWLWLDIYCTGFDWFWHFFGGDLENARVLCMLPLVRLAKVTKFHNGIKEYIDSEVTFIILNILQFILVMLIVSHLTASLWWTIGDFAMKQGAPNWIETLQKDNASLTYRYFTSLHWSLTQFTPGSMDVQPVCEGERIFASVVLVLGMVVFSSFTARITTSMSQLHHMTEDKSKQFWLLRRYLRQHNIDVNLSHRILRYAHHVLTRQQDRIAESKLWVLPMLSGQLRAELKYEDSFKCLNEHLFFATCAELSDSVIVKLVRNCLAQQSMAPGDMLFSSGAAATQMCMVVEGLLRYVKAQEAVFEDSVEDVRPHDWASEGCLWSDWISVGHMWSASESKLVQIDAKELQTVCRKDARILTMASGYAYRYVAWLNQRKRRQLTDLTNHEADYSLIKSFVMDVAFEEILEREPAQGSRLSHLLNAVTLGGVARLSTSVNPADRSSRTSATRFSAGSIFSKSLSRAGSKFSTLSSGPGNSSPGNSSPGNSSPGNSGGKLFQPVHPMELSLQSPGGTNGNYVSPSAPV